MRTHTDDFDDFEFFDNPDVRRLLRDEDRSMRRRHLRRARNFYDYAEDDGDDYDYDYYRELMFDRD